MECLGCGAADDRAIQRIRRSVTGTVNPISYRSTDRTAQVGAAHRQGPERIGRNAYNQNRSAVWTAVPGDQCIVVPGKARRVNRQMSGTGIVDTRDLAPRSDWNDADDRYDSERTGKRPENLPPAVVACR